MIEYHLTDNWICPKHGEVGEIIVAESCVTTYKKDSALGLFEFIRSIESEMTVRCKQCNSECYVKKVDQHKKLNESGNLSKELSALFM